MTTAPEHVMTAQVPVPEPLLPAPVAILGTDSAKASGNVNDGANGAAATDGAPAVALLAGHKGKLAIGVAATLGLMVYYGWREKRLAQTDPEEYARLQRIKAGLRSNADWPQPDDDGACDAVPPGVPALDDKS